jgi:hypothetical protein
MLRGPLRRRELLASVVDVSRVSVAPQPDGTFRVSVSDRGEQTTHVVSVAEGFCEKLGCRNVSDEELVEASFEFLLEREPPGSILRSFGLEVISGYFPEYGREMKKRIGSG